MSKIDAVVLWVDDQDLEWREERLRYDKSQIAQVDAGAARYRDWGIFKYWFRAIEENAPWLNKVYFVTYGHIPKWLDINHPKLVVVNHKEFIPAEYLPTFSSHTIELNLHRIEGLSEKFIYFNDDMYLMNSVSQEDFFVEELPCAIAALDAIVPEMGNSCVDYVKLNNMNILNKYIQKNQMLKKDPFKWFNLKYKKSLLKTILLLPWKNSVGMYESHQPTPFLKSTFEEVWRVEGEVLHRTCLNKFRQISDVNQWLLKNWQIMHGKFVPYSTKNCHYCEINNENKNLEKDMKQYKMVCINDSQESIDFEKAKASIIKSFEGKFPKKSTYELE